MNDDEMELVHLSIVIFGIYFVVFENFKVT